YSALMWLFSSMDPHVCLEVRCVIEGLSTLRTLMWLFPSMDPLVCLEMTHLTKGLPTRTALIGLFSCVYSLMNCKRGMAFKCFKTLGAFMLFLPGVQLVMYFLVRSEERRV